MPPGKRPIEERAALDARERRSVVSNAERERRQQAFVRALIAFDGVDPAGEVQRIRREGF